MDFQRPISCLTGIGNLAGTVIPRWSNRPRRRWSVKRNVLVASMLAWFLLSDPPAAYANNPPAPDGMLSIILLFPVAIFGFLFAGAKLTEKERKWKPVRGIVLGGSALLTAAGAGIAIIPLLILLGYGLIRGAQAMARGQGAKRFAIGSGMILFTLLAVANYTASLTSLPSTMNTHAIAAGEVRSIVTAEMALRANGKLDVNKNGIPEFGTLTQLQQAGLLPDNYATPNPRSGYHHVLVLADDPARNEKEFFLYSTPKSYGESPGFGISLLNVLRPRPTGGFRTFSADETGVIRSADLGGSRPVTREEAQKWRSIE